MVKTVRVSKTSAERKNRRLSYNFEFKHQFIVGIKPGNDGPTFEQVQDDIRKMLQERYPGGVYTPSGGYVLINGRACYPWDFDYETGDRKPGTVPPLYTLTEDEQKEIKLQERIVRERKRELRTGNTLATNPTHLLTASEVSKLQEVRARKPVRVRTGAGKQMEMDVEWSEKDAGDEKLVEAETAKLLKNFAPSKKVTVRRRG